MVKAIEQGDPLVSTRARLANVMGAMQSNDEKMSPAQRCDRIERGLIEVCELFIKELSDTVLEIPPPKDGINGPTVVDLTGRKFSPKG